MFLGCLGNLFALLEVLTMNLNEYYLAPAFFTHLLN